MYNVHTSVMIDALLEASGARRARPIRQDAEIASTHSRAADRGRGGAEFLALLSKIGASYRPTAGRGRRREGKKIHANRHGRPGDGLFREEFGRIYPVVRLTIIISIRIVV